jgi:hypothetical protein
MNARDPKQSVAQRLATAATTAAAGIALLGALVLSMPCADDVAWHAMPPLVLGASAA